MYVIEVRGDIIIRGGHQWAFDWVCLGKNGPRSQKDIELSTDSYSPSKFDKTTRCINGNLELSATRRAVPYAVYVAHGDIVLDSRAEDGYDGCGLGYRAPFFYWEESATSIKEKLNVQVDEKLRTTTLNGLYIECFGAFELLLCDLILSIIYTNDDCFNKAKEYWNHEHTNAIDEPETEHLIHEFIAKKVYHRFDTVKNLFAQIAGIEFPDTSILSALLHKRHNIVHRRSLSALDWMTSTNASVSDIEELLESMEAFVNELFSKIDSMYYHPVG